MADRYLIETSGVDGYKLEDASGVLLLEVSAGGTPPFFVAGELFSRDKSLKVKRSQEDQVSLLTNWLIFHPPQFTFRDPVFSRNSIVRQTSAQREGLENNLLLTTLAGATNTPIIDPSSYSYFKKFQSVSY